MTRPKGIELTTWLMVLSPLTEIIFLFFRWMPVKSAIHPTPHFTAEQLLLFIRWFIAIFFVIEMVALFFYWNGKNWARWLVMIDCVLCLWALRHIHHNWIVFAPGAVLAGYRAVLAIFLLWYLNTEGVRVWFTKKAAEANITDNPQPA